MTSSNRIHARDEHAPAKQTLGPTTCQARDARPFSDLAQLAFVLLRRRRVEAMTLALVSLVVHFAMASISLFFGSLAQVATVTASSSPMLVVERLVAGSPVRLSATDLERLQRVAGIRTIQARHSGYVYLSALDTNLLLTDAWQPAAEVSAASLRLWLQGHLPAADREVVVGSGVARQLGVSRGDSIALADAAGEPVLLSIVGITSDASAWVTADLLLTTTPTAQRMLGTMEPRDVALDVFPPEELAVVTQALSRLGFHTTTRHSALSAAHHAFGRLSLLPTLWVSLAFALLFVFVWLTTTTFMHRQALENAMLKLARRPVYAILLLRALELAVPLLVGAALGVSCAVYYVHGRNAPFLVTTFLATGLPIVLPQGVGTLELVGLTLVPTLLLVLFRWVLVARTLVAPVGVVLRGDGR